MDKVYIVSKCIDFANELNNSYIFHFRGYYKGQFINTVMVEANDYDLELGEEYLILLTNVTCQNKLLRGSAEKVKKLFATFQH
jgi:hypothetical protein